ncbi:MAG TPA: HEAT repeat domain-containing protein [Nitrolancea sp.]|nr:HEAT repeat domain-containing protein [Nitrolancea sp.]
MPKLSDIDRATAHAAAALWSQIPTDVRRFVARQMVEQAEANLELNFSRMLSIALDDPDAEVRTSAIQGLWEDESNDLLNRLLLLLESETEPLVREAIAEALSAYSYLALLEELDDEDVERVRRALLDLYQSDEPIAVRKRALESLAYFPDDLEVEDAIDEAFGSQYHDLRVGAIFAMGRNVSERWFGVLLGEMQDEDAEIRFEATRAIGMFGDERAVSLLIDMVDDEDREVQLAVIGALGAIGGTVAVGTLRRILRSEDSVINDAAQEALTEATIATDPLRFDR